MDRQFASGAFSNLPAPLRSSTAPLQLPEGVVIDLAASGVGLSNSVISFGAAVYNPMITFTASGAVGYVSSATGLQRPNGPIFLLVGRRDLMSDVSKSSSDENLYEPNTNNPLNLCLQNFWVSIGWQTGQVSVTENYPNNNSPQTARTLAVRAQSVGGR